jgi:hypothetical protein
VFARLKEGDMSFKCAPCSDRWHGVLAIVGLLALDALLVWRILARPLDGWSFVLALWLLASACAVAYLGYRTVGSFTMEYWVDRDAVTLAWGPTRQIVPMGQIKRIQRGAGQLSDRARPWHWPCSDRRRVNCANLGMLNSYATCPPARQVILVTDGESYGLSPADPDGFLRALQQRYALGLARPLQTELRRPPLWTWPLWRDRTALFLVGAGLVAVFLLFGVLSFRFPGLSSDLPLHFDVNGAPDRIAPKVGLFSLPVIGLLSWVFDLAAGIWTYRRVQRGAAYLLWGGALVVQVVAGLALYDLMRW